MEVDYSGLRFWFDILQWLVMGAIALWAWWFNRDVVRRKDVDERIGDAEDRLTQVERDQHHAPTHHDIGRVYERLNHTNSALAELTGQLGALASSLSRVETYLLNNSRGNGG